MRKGLDALHFCTTADADVVFIFAKMGTGWVEQSIGVFVSFRPLELAVSVGYFDLQTSKRRQSPHFCRAFVVSLVRALMAHHTLGWCRAVMQWPTALSRLQLSCYLPMTVVLL